METYDISTCYAGDTRVMRGFPDASNSQSPVSLGGLVFGGLYLNTCLIALGAIVIGYWYPGNLTRA